MYQRLGKFDPLIEKAYGELFRAQMNKDWKKVESIAKALQKLEEQEDRQERTSPVEEDSQGLWNYERAVR